MASTKTFAPTMIRLAYRLAVYLARYDTQIRVRNSLSTDQLAALTGLETALTDFRAAFTRYEEAA